MTSGQNERHVLIPSVANGEADLSTLAFTGSHWVWLKTLRKALASLLLWLEPFSLSRDLVNVGISQDAAKTVALHLAALRLGGSPWRRMLRPSWWREVRVEFIAKSGEFQGGSETLGLALGIVMAATRSKRRWVFATGELVNIDNPGPDVDAATQQVRAVNTVPEKLTALLRYREAKLSRGDALAPLLVLIPKDNANDAKVAELIQNLDTQVTVVPVKTFADAMAAAGCGPLARTMGEKVTVWTVSAVVAVALSVAGTAVYRDQMRQRPISMYWESLADSAGTLKPTPMRSTSRDWKDRKEWCMVNGVPALRPGEYILVNLRIGRSEDGGTVYPLAFGAPDMATAQVNGPYALSAEPQMRGGDEWRVAELIDGQQSGYGLIAVVADPFDVRADFVQALSQEYSDFNSGKSSIVIDRLRREFGMPNCVNAEACAPQAAGRHVYFQYVVTFEETCR